MYGLQIVGAYGASGRLLFIVLYVVACACVINGGCVVSDLLRGRRFILCVGTSNVPPLLSRWPVTEVQFWHPWDHQKSESFAL